MLAEQHYELMSEIWQINHPRNCPVKLRDGDGKSVGTCWHFLRNERCPVHGKIVREEKKP